jgi:hypothetical protein
VERRNQQAIRDLFNRSNVGRSQEKAKSSPIIKATGNNKAATTDGSGQADQESSGLSSSDEDFQRSNKRKKL